MSKNLKVIVCAYNPDRLVRTGCKYPDHNQELSTWEDHELMFSKIIEVELNHDAGVPVDTLIVCNNDCCGFFDKYNGVKTKNGKIIVRYRNNIGGSFGGYSYAYQNFKYRTYLFTEDDLIVFGDHYYKKILDRMETEKADFVALLGISPNGRFPEHAHGGIGVATRETLDAIAVDGELPYHHGEWQHSLVIYSGEIPFTNNMLKSGKKMIYYGKEEWSADNLLLPYYDVHTT